MYDHEHMADLRAAGLTWPQVVARLGLDATPKQVRQAHHTWRKRREGGSTGETPGAHAPAPSSGEPWDIEGVIPPDEARRITSLDDLLRFFGVDTEVWQVKEFRVNSWEQHSIQKGVVPLYQVKARLMARGEALLEPVRDIWEDFIADAKDHAPRYEAPAVIIPDGDDPVLAEIAIMDPHFGMLAHGSEVGGISQDLKTIEADYAAAVEHLLGVARIYPVERVLYLVGNDTHHVNQTGAGGKGATTKRGTEQDFDTRIHKIFTTVRRSVVAGVDRARTVAPVDVVVVPGNHDPDESYRLGEVLHAWYRHDEAVTVYYGPNKRQAYQYGANGFMLTHGEEQRRRRDPLPLIFADEFPDVWATSTHREIHTGHLHVRLQGGYFPDSDVSESRGCIHRSLPGLTATDAWHHEEGYRHTRAATLLVYRRSGGLAGLHEFNL